MCIGLALSACTAIQAQRGQIIPDEQLAQLKIGTTSKAEVLALIGTPTSVSAFDDMQWYYIGEDTKQIGIHPAIPVVRRVVSLKFDTKGTLTDEHVLSKEDGEKIAMRPSTTQVMGEEPTLVQQLIGNVGRFSGSGDAGSK